MAEECEGTIAEIVQASCSVTPYNYYDYVNCVWKFGVKIILADKQTINRDLNIPTKEVVIGQAALPGGNMLVDSRDKTASELRIEAAKAAGEGQ